MVVISHLLLTEGDHLLVLFAKIIVVEGLIISIEEKVSFIIQIYKTAIPLLVFFVLLIGRLGKKYQH